MNPPFVGAAICASTLVIAFSFAVSRPCLTLKVGTFVQYKQTLNILCLCRIFICNQVIISVKLESDDGGRHSFSQQGHSYSSNVTVC